jgi:hypothetical protein
MNWRNGPSTQNRIDETFFLGGGPHFLSLEIGLQINIVAVNAVDYRSSDRVPTARAS